jgi:ribosome-associated protein
VDKWCLSPSFSWIFCHFPSHFVIRGKAVVTHTTIDESSVLPAGRQRGLQLAMAAARTAAENRGQDLVILDLRELTSFFDYFVIATGASRRQLHAMSEEIDRVLEKELGDCRMGIEGYQECRWILLDYGDVVIHLFDAQARAFYDLENLWAEAKRVDLTSLLADL